MNKVNILNKAGLLTEVDRKQPLTHGCRHFTFKSCLDLSEPIKVIPHGNYSEVRLETYSSQIASFISWWTHFVKKDLNGFSGFSNVKFEPVGFVVTNK